MGFVRSEISKIILNPRNPEVAKGKSSSSHKAGRKGRQGQGSKKRHNRNRALAWKANRRAPTNTVKRLVKADENGGHLKVKFQGDKTESTITCEPPARTVGSDTLLEMAEFSQRRSNVLSSSVCFEREKRSLVWAMERFKAYLQTDYACVEMPPASPEEDVLIIAASQDLV